VAGAAATAAASAPAREAAGRRRGTGASRGEHGKLNRGFLARTLRAGDFRLLVDYDLFEALIATVTDIFVDGHVELFSRLRRKCAVARTLIIPQEHQVMYQPPLGLMVCPARKSLSASSTAMRPISSGEPGRRGVRMGGDHIGFDRCGSDGVGGDALFDEQRGAGVRQSD
jgi:hypothetical protein